MEALRLANDLRLKGLAVDLSYGKKSLKSQMRRADKLGCHYVVILGEEELKTRTVVVRDMETKTQDDVELDRIAEILTDRFEPT